jgi:hypothetical protein
LRRAPTADDLKGFSLTQLVEGVADNAGMTDNAVPTMRQRLQQLRSHEPHAVRSTAVVATAPIANAEPVPSPCAEAPPTASDIEQTVIEIILAAPPAGVPAAHAHAHKEQQLRSVFAGLEVIDAWHLHRRLSNPAASDPLVAAFMRFVPDRRARLLAFLGDARRRQALARAAG